MHGDLCKHLGIDSSTDQMIGIRSVLESTVLKEHGPRFECKNKFIFCEKRQTDVCRR